MTILLVIIAVVLLVGAFFILRTARYRRSLGGLPAGELVYADNFAEKCPVLVSNRYGLKGRPDALVRTQLGEVIPVERKNSRAPQHGPHDGDLIQATAYCVLVEEAYGRIPPFMRIQYADAIMMSPTRQKGSNEY